MLTKERIKIFLNALYPAGSSMSLAESKSCQSAASEGGIKQFLRKKLPGNFLLSDVDKNLKYFLTIFSVTLRLSSTMI